MLDLFGIRAKIEVRKKAQEEKKLAEVMEKKKAYQERKAKIDNYLNDYYEKTDKKLEERYEQDKARAEKINSTCPKCGSKNVVQKIVRTKGELHGEGNCHGYGSHSLFGGSYSSYGHSEIDGKLDTYPVNRCKDCENEWKVVEVEYPHNYYDAFSTYNSFCPARLLFSIEDYLEMKFNPEDMKEECNSLEEKREKYIEKTSSSSFLVDYQNVPRYMIEYALYLAIIGRWGIPDWNKLFNYHKDDDKYSFTMSDELWELVKKLIGWKGTENENSRTI